MLLAALDQTIVATAMPTIGLELGDAANLPWIVTAYLLASTAVTPLYGKLSDIHGRRIMLLIAITTFSVGSLLCALAPTMIALALARGFRHRRRWPDRAVPDHPRRHPLGQGAGALSGLHRGRVRPVLGGRPLLGGFFAQHLHWSAIFWINLPIGLAASSSPTTSSGSYPATSGGTVRRLSGRGAPRRELDQPDAGLSWGGVRYPWGSAPVLGLAGFGLLSGAAFAVRLATASEPLIPLSVLRDRVVTSANARRLLRHGHPNRPQHLRPDLLEGVIGLDPSRSGLAMVPLMVGTVVGATLSGRSMAYLRHYKRLPLALLTLSVCACGLLAFMGPELPLGSPKSCSCCSRWGSARCCRSRRSWSRTPSRRSSSASPPPR